MYRWYASGWGRYTQVDPLSVAVYVTRPGRTGAKDVNTYLYASSSPAMNVDPFGAVNWTKGAPVYYGPRSQDRIREQCGARTSGCTQYLGSKDPVGKCRCTHGGYRLEISMSLSIQVYVRNDHPSRSVALIFSEEEKHVQAANRVFDEFVKIGQG